MVGTERHSTPWRLKFHLHKNPPRPSSRPTSRASSPAGLKAHNDTRPRSAIPLDFTRNIPMNIPYPPFVNVEGVPNFRDVGGYDCIPASSDAPHTSVRQGFVYRCSELSQITPLGDVTMVDKLKVRTMFDLRSEREAANPKGKPQGVHVISTPVFRMADTSQAMVVQQLRWSTSPDNPPDAGFSQGYVNWYRQIAVWGAKYAFPIIFKHILEKPDEPFVYHCTAGKDRTGVLSAIILSLCGVDPAAAAWDYSLTVPGMGLWEEAVEMEIVGDSMMPIRSHGGMTVEEARRVCGSRASNMEQWLKAVLEGEFGGAEKYLTEHCGFSVEDVEKIKFHLLVPGEGKVKPVEIKGLEEHPQM